MRVLWRILWRASALVALSAVLWYLIAVIAIYAVGWEPVSWTTD